MVKLDYHPPAPELRDFVSVYYLFDCELPDFTDHERAAIAQIRYIYRGHGRTTFATGESFDDDSGFLVGPSSGVMRFQVEGPFRLFGVGLLPAGWAALTDRSAADHADRTVPLAEIWPDIDDSFAALDKDADLSTLAAASDAVLRPLMEKLPASTLAFTRTVDGWLSSEPSPQLSALQNKVQLSDRQLTRRVKQIYGMPPKYLSRKYRALRAARALVNADSSEGEFLRDAFYDQSHMIRELKLFTGVTPTKLRKGEGDIAVMIDQRAKLGDKISPLTSET